MISRRAENQTCILKQPGPGCVQEIESTTPTEGKCFSSVNGRFGCRAGPSERTQRLRVIFVFVDPLVLALFSLSFLLDVTVLFPPQHLSLFGSVGCFVYKAGKPSFSK